MKGLKLRKFENSAAYYLAYRTRGGKRRNPKIGAVPGTSLKAAQSIARSILAQVAMGRDPGQEWKEKRQQMTLNEIFEKACTSHWNSPRFESSGWRHELGRIYAKRIKPVFGSEKITDIKLIALRAWFHSMQETPGEANQSMSVLSRIFTYALEQELVSYNPCKLIKRNVIRKRSFVPNETEIRLIMQRLQDDIERGDARALFIMALVYTGSRPQVLQKAKWKDLVIDGKTANGILTFHGKGTSDSGEDEIIVFSPTLLNLILEKFDTRSRIDNRIFELPMYSNYWVKIRKELGVTKMWARDLRRAFASIGLTHGFSMDTMSAALNHKSTATTRTYAKIFDERKIEVATVVGRHLDNFLITPEETPQLPESATFKTLKL